MSAVEATEIDVPKKHKKEKSAKKRAREEEQTSSERKHKRSKSVAPDGEAAPAPVDEVKKDKKDKKEKKKHKTAKLEETDDATEADNSTQETVIPDTPPKSSKKEKKKSKRHDEDEAADSQPTETPDKKDKKKKKKKSKPEPEAEPSETDDAVVKESQESAPDAMDIDTTPAKKSMPPPPKPSSSSKIHAPPDMPPEPLFPFFNQTVSLYEPLLPSGWAAPITGCESQHLRHLHNRYVPSLRGVLLDYGRVTLGERPGRGGGAAAEDSETALLTSKIEFGGGFGWITADVRLFIPSRGAWMEGSINLQTEGHVGVVCFGRFNASIEASRLPPSWTWVPNEQAEFEETASVVTGADEHGVVRQIHSTGYWVDGDGDKVKGRIRFRIRNFDVGVSGNSTFLSLQGTMLDGRGEKTLVKKEAEEAKNRKQRKGGYQGRKRAPEFSMTRFATEEEGETVPEEVAVPAEELPTQGEAVASVTANGDDAEE